MNTEPDSASPPSPPWAADWYPDPLGRYDHRYHNGTQWTADVSQNGQRYVDPVPLSSGSAPHLMGTPSERRSRTLAVLTLLAGIAAIGTAWIPFVVVIGVVAAVLGIVLGIVALRRIRSGRADGRSLAITGLALASVGALIAPVGIVLTVIVTREVIEFVDVGPHTGEVTECVPDSGQVMVAGTVTNKDDTAHEYSVLVRIVDRSGAAATTLATTMAHVDRVAAGATADWSTTVAVRDLPGDTEALRCEIE